MKMHIPAQELMHQSLLAWFLALELNSTMCQNSSTVCSHLIKGQIVIE